MQQLFRPLGLPEAHQHKIVALQNGPLDQHAVFAEQAVLLVLAHAGQLFLESQALIQKAAGVEKAPQGQPAGRAQRAQLFCAGVFLLDVARDIVDAVRIQPRLGALAGAAFGIPVKSQRSSPLFFCIQPARTAAASSHTAANNSGWCSM